MLRAITIMALFLLATSLQAQQSIEQTQARNPFRIDLGNDAVAALKKNPQGLIWKFDELNAGEHDGIWVTFEAKSTRSNNYFVNDRTTKNLFSLDVNDDILRQLFDDPAGLQALIDPADRSKLTGVILRYTPPLAAANAPDSSILPVRQNPTGNPSGGSFSGNQSTPLTSSNLGFNANPAATDRPLYEALAVPDRFAASKDPPFFSSNQRASAPLAKEFNTSRQSSLIDPTFEKQRASIAYNNTQTPIYSWERDALNQKGSAQIDPYAQRNLNPRLNQDMLTVPASQTNFNRGEPQRLDDYQNGYGPNQPPVRRDSSYVPQVAMNGGNYPVSTIDPRESNTNISATLASVEAARNSAIQQLNEVVAERDSARFQLTTIASDYQTAKSQQFLLWFLLLLAVGLCLYLSLLARGFYYRYGELADELRETFTTTN